MYILFCYMHSNGLPDLDNENKIQTTISFRFIQFFIQVGLHTYMGHTIDAIATKHLLGITELHLRYLHQLW